MKFRFIPEIIKYDGTQLRSHFAYKNYGLPGNSIIAFTGPVDVRLTEMVDIEDVILKEGIAADEMLNFIIEVFHMDLPAAVCLQRLFISIIKDELNGLLDNPGVVRDGDDLYYKERKLSVSIAAASPVSSLIHCALNIKPTGAPVKISCLEEMGVNAEKLAGLVLEKFTKEYEGMEFAAVKVNWVG